MSPGQWIDYVESKKYDDISVVQSVDGEIRFLTQLSAESQVWQLHICGLHNLNINPSTQKMRNRDES
jgi:hypothetical protein